MQIIRTRLYVDEKSVTRQPTQNDCFVEPSLVPKFLTLREQEQFYRKNLDPQRLRYLLVVSMLEPRKNHLRLVAGWEAIKAQLDPDLKLVVVGSLGWDYETLVKASNRGSTRVTFLP